jgi:hypothetical protein
MRHFALAVLCGMLLPFAKWRERKAERESKDLLMARWLAWRAAQTIPKPRVAAWTFQTTQGTELGWHVRAHCVEEAAEIVSQSPIFARST